MQFNSVHITEVEILLIGLLGLLVGGIVSALQAKIRNPEFQGG
jgi:hypothetical protein